MTKFTVGRRQFAFGAATVAATALIRPSQAIAQAGALPQSDPGKPAATLDQLTQAAMAKLSPKAQAEVEMKVSEIFRKYGDKLSDEQKADIRRIMAETQEGLEKMRVFPLENGDQPADAFRAYRREEKK